MRAANPRLGRRRLLRRLEPLRWPDVGHAEVRHRLTGGGPMPMALAWRGIDDVTWMHHEFLIGGADPAFACEDIEHLFPGMDVPVGTRPILEVHDTDRH